jgi:sortase A
MKAQKGLRCIEIALWMAGSAALVYCGFVLSSAAITQARLQRELEQANAAGPHKVAGPAAPGLVGRLEIRRLGISDAVLEGVDAQTMRVAVGHVPGTAKPGQPGNVVMAAHRDTFFRPLRKIKANDEIRFDTGVRTLRYRVVSTEIVDPKDVAVLRSHHKDELTLITCYPFYYVGSAPKRFIVHAVPITERPRRTARRAARSTTL